jgi:hypothetical protein
MKNLPALSDPPAFTLPSLPWNSVQAQRVLNHLSRSGLSAAQFSRNCGIAVHQIYMWRHRLHVSKPRVAAKPDSGFLPVCVEPAAASTPAASTQADIELVHPTGVIIRLRGRVPAEHLAGVLRTLGAVSC